VILTADSFDRCRRMSLTAFRSFGCSARQTVILGPSLSGLGKRPDLTPAHKVVRPTGMGPWGERIE
jgi:hypothetical protein